MAEASVRLVLIRHGESEWNAAGILQGHGGTGLSTRGHAEAAATAAHLAERLPRPLAIIRSDLQRVTETAAPAERELGVPVRIDARLREIDVGTWTGKTRADLAREDPAGLAAWRAGEDIPRGGGETFAQLRHRVWSALGDVVAEAAGDNDGWVAVFTHGGPIRVAVAAALGLPEGAERALEPVANCSLTVLHAHPDHRAARFTLAAYNRADHLLDVAARDDDRSAVG